ncbi:MAG TPA: ABC transporter permease [Candidatus Binataceae bacterium]|nr:ABC transporter permease [Candidatus Binataceae bacterium]
MRFEYLIGVRYLRARRHERFVSLIALISLAGVAIGTFALTVVLSVMSGFEEDLRNRLLAFNPEIAVTVSPHDAAQIPSLAGRVAALPGIVGVAPFATSQVMLVSTTAAGTPAYVAGATLRAVEARHNPVLRELESTLTAGARAAAMDQSFPVSVSDRGVKRVVQLPGALIGDGLAEDLAVRVGEAIIVIAPASLGAGSTPRLRRFVVAGLFHSGMFEYDSSLIFVALRNGQALLADDPQLEQGVEARAANLFDAPALARRIAAGGDPGLAVTDWTQTDAPLFAALKLEKFTYFLVLLLIVLVAAFNIIATLVMVVMERRKEIAILRAMGARAGSIAAIFLCEGAALGIGGTLLGVGVGFIVSFLIGKYHFIHLPADLFMVSTVPVRLYAVNFIAVAVAAIALCLAGAIYPAMRARTLSPVEVIRYE